MSELKNLKVLNFLTFILLFALFLNTAMTTIEKPDFSEEVRLNHFTYATTIIEHQEIKDMTIKVSLNRFKFYPCQLNSDTVHVFVDKIFLPTNISLDDLKENPNVGIRRMVKCTFFGQNFYRATSESSQFEEKMSCHEMTQDLYLKMTRSKLTRGSWRMRFNLSEEEVAILDGLKMKFPNGTDEKTAKPKNNDKITELVSNATSVVGARKSKQADRKAMKWEDMVSVTSEVIANVIKPDKEIVSKFLLSRHDKFGKIVLEKILKDRIDPSKWDKTVREIIGNKGKHQNRTPDYMEVFRDDSGKMTDLVMYEFAVTDVEASSIFSRKVMKYEDMLSDLSEEYNCNVRAHVFVLSTKENNVICDPEYEDLASELVPETLELSEMSTLLLSNKDFSDLKKDLREEEDVSDNDSFFEQINGFLLEEFSPSGMKSVDLARSRENLPRILTTLKEDILFNEVIGKSKELLNSDYEANLTKNLKDRVARCEYSPEVKEMLNTKNLDLLNEAAKIFRQQNAFALEVRSRANFKMPKLFKMPLLQFTEKSKKTCSTETIGFFSKNLEDGTIMMKRVIEEPEDDPKDEHTEGIYCHEQDEADVENMITTLQQPSSQYFRESTRAFRDKLKETLSKKGYSEPSSKTSEELSEQKDSTWIDKFFELKVAEVAFNHQKVCENICYLENRRFLELDEDEVEEAVEKIKDVHFREKAEEEMSKRVNSYHVMKDFGKYSVILKKGSKLTKEKVLRYRVLAEQDSFIDIPVLHTYKREMKGTTWLTMSSHDLNHFSRIFDKCLAIVSHMNDMSLEADKVDVDLKTKDVFVPLIILLEHKRGTSTSAQLYRYLLHSNTSYVSYRISLLRSIMEDPVRSRVESYVRMNQVKWMVKSREECVKMIDLYNQTVLMTNSEYDRVYVPSFFDFSKKKEMSWVMNDMYLGNLFNKESGFKAHRMKQVVFKQEKHEMHFRKVRKSEESSLRTNVDDKILDSKDTYHTGSSPFIRMMGVKLSKKLRATGSFNEALNKALCTTVNHIMKLTSSLEKAPINNMFLEFSKRMEKDYSFNTMRRLIGRLETDDIIKIMDKIKGVDVVMSIFSKSQIGGPREILIQSIMSRIYIKFTESVSHNLCELHEKEMMTHSSRKESWQSDTMNTFKTMAMSARKKGSAPTIMSLNTDSSKWAQAMVMEQLLIFVDSLGLPDKVAEILLNTIKAFSSKIVLLSEDVARKFTKWEHSNPAEKEEYDFIKDELNKNLTPGMKSLEVNSGMGQGMLHYLSSLYHCAQDDVFDELLEKCVSKDIKTSSAVSSDDKTKLMFMKGGVRNREIILKVVHLFDMVSRLANIHVNWKKTALQLMITEFNSLFSIGKRMIVASIKDVYSSVEAVDLSQPEIAVKSSLSSIRRCMEHGVYLPTVKLLMTLSREWIKDSYRFDESVVKQLCKSLDCDESRLPHSLGFLPLEFPVETLIYGPEIHIFSPSNSQKLTDFYHGLYTCLSTPSDKSYMPTNTLDYNMSGKFSLRLPMKVDTKLKAMRREFYGSEENVNKEVLKMNRVALCVGRPLKDPEVLEDYVSTYMLGLGLKYEFDSTFVVQTRVRALQMCSGKCIIEPSGISDVSIFDFVSHCLERKSMRSLVSMFSNLSSVIKAAEEVERKLATSERVYETIRHPKIRNLRFFTAQLSDQVRASDVIDNIFSDLRTMPTRTKKMMERLMTSLGTDMRAFSNNPFGEIRKVFPESSRPFLDFKEFIEYSSEVLKFTSIKMLSDEPDGGNMAKNLSNLYRTRSHAEFVYSENLFYKEKSTALEFSTGVSMNIDLVTLVNELKLDRDVDLEIKSSDSNIEKVAKSVAKMGYGSALGSKIICEKVYEMTRNKRHDRATGALESFDMSLTDLTSLVEINASKGTFKVKLYQNKGALGYKMSPNLTTELKKRITTMRESGMTQRKNKEFKRSEIISFYANEIEFVDEDPSVSISITYLVKKWEARYVVNVSDFDRTFYVYSNPYVIDKIDISCQTLKRKISDLRSISSGDADLEYVAETMIANSWTAIVASKENEISDEERKIMANVSEKAELNEVYESMFEGKPMFDIETMNAAFHEQEFPPLGASKGDQEKEAEKMPKKPGNIYTFLKTTSEEDSEEMRMRAEMNNPENMTQEQKETLAFAQSMGIGDEAFPDFFAAFESGTVMPEETYFTPTSVEVSKRAYLGNILALSCSMAFLKKYAVNTELISHFLHKNLKKKNEASSHIYFILRRLVLNDISLYSASSAVSLMGAACFIASSVYNSVRTKMHSSLCRLEDVEFVKIDKVQHKAYFVEKEEDSSDIL